MGLQKYKNDLRPRFNAKGFRIIWNIMTGFRLIYLIAILMIAVAAVARTATFFLLQRFVDGALSVKTTALIVIWFALGFVFLAVLEAVTSYYRGKLAAGAAEGIVLEIRNFMFDHIQRLPFTYHDRVRTGDLIERVTSDVDTIHRFFSEQATEVGRILALFLVNFAGLLLIGPLIALASLVFLPLLVLLSFWFFKRISRVYDAYQTQEASLSSTLQENIAAARVVRAFAQAEYEEQKFEKDNAEKLTRGRRLVLWHALYWPVTDIVCFAQTLVVFIIGAGMTMRGEMSPGELVAVLGMVSMIVWPLRNLGRVVIEASMASVSCLRLAEVAREEPEEREALPRPRGKRRIRGELVFDRVGFHYATDEYVLTDVSFTCPAGLTFALMGPTGSGKTTLVNLIPRFYRPSTGRILLDGRDLSAYPLAELRESIGIVEQEPFLFSRTIRENIAYGTSREARDAEIEAAARAACLHDVIMSFPDGYRTLVGEKGVTLSGGQKQRLAVARTILKDPPILILDDATAAVDLGTEAEIQAALRRLMRNRTCLIIAHRAQAVKHADRIIVLGQGRVVQAGSHAQLLRQEGFYRKVYELQSRIETPHTKEEENVR